MTKKLSIVSILLAVAMIVSLLITPVILAEETTEQEVETTSESIEQQKQEKYEAYKAELEKKREAAKQKAEEQVEAAKQKAEAKKQEVREKNCEARKNALANKIKATSEAAKRHYDKVTSFNEKIEAFVDKNALTVENYETLKTAVADKAALSEDAVTSLTEFEQEVDCTNIDKATADVIEYKELLKTARDALKEYRTATKDLLVAVKTSAEAATSDDATEEATN